MPSRNRTSSSPTTTRRVVVIAPAYRRRRSGVYAAPNHCTSGALGRSPLWTKASAPLRRTSALDPAFGCIEVSTTRGCQGNAVNCRASVEAVAVGKSHVHQRGRGPHPPRRLEGTGDALRLADDDEAGLGEQAASQRAERRVVVDDEHRIAHAANDRARAGALGEGKPTLLARITIPSAGSASGHSTRQSEGAPV